MVLHLVERFALARALVAATVRLAIAAAQTTTAVLDASLLLAPVRPPRRIALVAARMVMSVPVRRLATAAALPGTAEVPARTAASAARRRSELAILPLTGPVVVPTVISVLDPGLATVAVLLDTVEAVLHIAELAVNLRSAVVPR